MKYYSNLSVNRSDFNLKKRRKLSFIKDHKTKFKSAFTRNYSQKENRLWRMELNQKIKIQRKFKVIVLVLILSTISYLTVLCIEQQSLFTSI